jgi:hypothetical protein
LTDAEREKDCHNAILGGARMRILSVKQEIPESIDRQAREAGLSGSDYYAGPTVSKKTSTSQVSAPAQRNEDLESKMIAREKVANASAPPPGPGLVQRMQQRLQGRQRGRLLSWATRSS